MDDTQYEIQKTRVLRFITKWRKAGFGWWNITYVWERSLKEDEIRKVTVPAQITEKWEYLNAEITFYLGSIETLTDDEVENAVVHEHAHLLVGSIRNYDTDESRKMTEFSVTLITNALLNTHKFVNE